MAATTTPTLLAAGAALQAVAPRTGLRRRIAPEAGRALEKLGHAIEYLADEFVHAGGCLTPHDARLDAMQILIAANREVYFSCPPLPGLKERLRALLPTRPS